MDGVVTLDEKTLGRLCERFTGDVRPEKRSTERVHGFPLIMPVWAGLANSSSDDGV